MPKRKYQPDTLEAALKHLRAADGIHLKLAQAVLSADEGRLFMPDLVMKGVLQRSLDLIDGFCLLVERGNAACAVPLLRLQIDSLMRLVGLSLVDDMRPVLEAFLNDKPLKDVKTRNNQKMHDKVLLDEVERLFPGFAAVYKKTSGFIHFSQPAMLSAAVGVNEREDGGIDVAYEIGVRKGRPWTEAERKEAVDAFIFATEALLEAVRSWGTIKMRVAATR